MDGGFIRGISKGQQLYILWSFYVLLFVFTSICGYICHMYPNDAYQFIPV